MRLLIAGRDGRQALRLEGCLECLGLDWQVTHASSGEAALRALSDTPYELMLLDAYLPILDGEAVLERLIRAEAISPPRVLLLCERELRQRGCPTADCVAPLLTSDEKRARLLATLSQRICPMLAARSSDKRRARAAALLDSLAMPTSLKGREYALWLLDTLIHSPFWIDQLTNRLYPACAKTYGVSAASVERCLRKAIEETFTVGCLEAVEQLYGASVDPEKGKLTNRAFLLATAGILRQSLRTA